MPQKKKQNPLNESQRELFESNLWLAEATAKQFSRKIRGRDPERKDDDYSAALLGLYTAVERWTNQQGSFDKFARSVMRYAMMDRKYENITGHANWKVFNYRRDKVRQISGMSTESIRQFNETTDQSYDWKTHVEQVDECEFILGKLSPSLSSFLRLRYIDGLSLKEASRAIGIGYYWASHRLAYARSQARAIMGVT